MLKPIKSLRMTLAAAVLAATSIGGQAVAGPYDEYAGTTKMRERQTLELGQDEGDYDLIAYVVFSKADYVYADQLENLARYFMNPKLSDPGYDSDDLIDGYVYTALKHPFLAIARTSSKSMA